MKNPGSKKRAIIYLICTVLFLICAVINYVKGQTTIGLIFLIFAMVYGMLSFLFYRKSKDERY